METLLIRLRKYLPAKVYLTYETVAYKLLLLLLVDISIKSLMNFHKILSHRNDMMFKTGTKLIHVYYSALNFKDVLLATGFLSYEIFLPKRTMQVNLPICLLNETFYKVIRSNGFTFGMHCIGIIVYTYYSAYVPTLHVPDT